MDQSFRSFEKCIKNRANEVARIQKLDDNSPERFFAYFGFKEASGRHDTRYADTMDGIENNLNGVIFFSIYLSEKLCNRGIELEKKLGLEPTMVSGNFWVIKQRHLLPDRNLYPDWQD